MPKPSVLVAIIAGSAFSSALTAVVLMLTDALRADAVSSDFASAYAIAFLALAAVTGLIAFTIGLAWHALAMKQHWYSPFAYTGAASATGATLAALILMPSGFTLTSASWGLLAIGAVHGGVTGLSAWLIRRPDRDAPNPPTPSP